MEELKSCPFCGKSPKGSRFDGIEWASCRNDRCCLFGVEIHIEAWNRRTEPQAGAVDPQTHDEAQARIEAHVRQIQIIADNFGYDPCEWLNDEAAQSHPASEGEGFVRVPSGLIDRLRQWNAKWPKGRVFSYGEHKECERELDAIVDKLIAAATKEGT